MIITLTGENDAQRSNALRQIAGGYDDMAIERLDGEEVGYERMYEAAQSLPFLVDKKLVILRTPGANKDFTENFEQFAAGVAETNTIVLVEPKPDKRTAYYKQLQKLTDFQDYRQLDTNGTARQLMQYVSDQGGSLSASDARKLVERVGIVDRANAVQNYLTLQHEVDKLMAYDPSINAKSIELLTEPTLRANAFAMLDAAFAGSAKKALELYDEQRAAQVEWQVIFGAIVWQLHALALAKAGGGQNSKAQSLGRKMSAEKLKSLITTLREFDVRLKTESLDADETLRYYLLNLATIS